MIYDYGIPDFMPIQGLDDLREQLPSIFNNSLSDAQRLVSVINCVNRMGLIVGEIADNWSAVEEWIKENGVDKSVESILNRWAQDGTLAKILDETTLKELEKHISDLENELKETEEANKKYVDEQVALMNAHNTTMWNNVISQINEKLAGGAIKEVFATVDELKGKYPNGAEGVFLVVADKHIYYWSIGDKTWVDAGSYASPVASDESLELSKLAPNATNAILLLDGQGMPDYDDTTHTFNFNSGTQQAALIWGQGHVYRIPTGTTVINTIVDKYTSARLLFNTEDNSFYFKPWDTKLDKKEVSILVLRDRWNSSINNTLISASFPVTVNGHLQTTEETIIPKMLTKSNATGVFVSPSAMKFPDYDLNTHILNFNSKINERDTTVTIGYNGERYAVPAGTTVTNEVAQETSNAVLIFIPETKDFKFIKWSDPIPDNAVQLGMLRELSGLATNQATKANFSGAFTMTFNGKYPSQLGNDNLSMATIIQSDRFSPDYDDRKHVFRFNSQRRTLTNDGYEPKAILTYNGVQFVLDNDVTVVNNIAITRNTSVQKLIFDTTNQTFSFVRNDTPLANNQWVVAIVRDDNSLDQNTLFNTTVIAEFPVTVNGLPQGQTINEKDANMIGILHRGAMDYAPEESIPAYKMAREIGFNHIEGDVHFTKDGIPVMIHDETINRTAYNADGSKISENIAVSEHTLDELNQYSYAMIHNKFRPEFKDTKLCTFEEMVKIGKAYNYQLHVEIKVEMTKEQIQTLVDIAIKYGMLDNIGWQSFTHEWLKPLQEIYPKATLELLTNDNPSDELLAEMQTYQNDKNYVIGSFSSNASPDGMDKFAKAGIGLYVWTLYSNQAIQSWLSTPVSGVMVQGEVNPAKAMMYLY